MSSCLRKPSVTPMTMLFTRLRVRPWRARLSRSSSGRATSSCPSTCCTLIVAGTMRVSSPLGPLTLTMRPSIVTSTPEGIAMGACPIRDISASPRSPDEAQDFAADLALARLTVGHQPLRGGQDGHTEAAEDAGHAGGVAVDPQAGRGDPLDARDRAITVGRVLHADREDLADALRGRRDLVRHDVALLLEDLGERDLLLGRRHLDLVVHRRVGVADTGQHVG